MDYKSEKDDYAKRLANNETVRTSLIELGKITKTLFHQLLYKTESLILYLWYPIKMYARNFLFDIKHNILLLMLNSGFKICFELVLGVGWKNGHGYKFPQEKINLHNK